MKDIKIKLKLDKNGFGQVVTEEITGYLEAVLILSPLKSQLTINSDAGYGIFNFKEAEGSMYIPIRVQALNNLGSRISFSSDRILLNEKLTIKAQQLMRWKTMPELQVILRIA